MFKAVLKNHFHKRLSRIVGLIFVLEIVAIPYGATNSTTSEHPLQSTPGSDETTEDYAKIMGYVGYVSAPVVVICAVALVIYVAAAYVKREKQRALDLESGRRERKAENEYDSRHHKCEKKVSQESQPVTQGATADVYEDVIEEDEGIDDGPYTRIEITQGSGKGASNSSKVEAKEKNASNVESSDDLVLYTKAKKTKKKVAANGANPLYSQVIKNGSDGATKSKSVEDLYTKVTEKAKRKGKSTAADDELYTKPVKKKKKKDMHGTNGSIDDLYTKSQKHGTSASAADDLYTKSQKHGTSASNADDVYAKSQKDGATASANPSVDELYTKPRKKRVKLGKKDGSDEYSKPIKKKIKKPFYMNNAATEAANNKAAKAAVVKDNELYTDIPD